MDAATKSVLEKGSRNVEILKQPQFSPVTVEKQIAIIHLGTSNLLRSVPVNKIREFEAAYLEYLDAKHKDTLEALRKGVIDDEVKAVLNAACKEIAKNYAA